MNLPLTNTVPVFNIVLNANLQSLFYANFSAVGAKIGRASLNFNTVSNQLFVLIAKEYCIGKLVVIAWFVKLLCLSKLIINNAL